MPFPTIIFKRPRITKMAGLLLIILVTLTNVLGVAAAPTPQTAVPDAVTPAAPDHRALYLPALGNDHKRTETREVSVVRLDEPAVQTQSKAAPPSTASGALPAPPPGAELYPAQPDIEAPATSDAPVASAETDATVTLLQEDFEESFPRGNWRVLDQNGPKNGEYMWDEDTFKPYNGRASAWVANGGSNGLDPEYYNYPNNLLSWMIFGPFDLSDAANAYLQFVYWNVSEMHYDHLGWYASPNGTDFYGLRVSGNSRGWTPVTLDFANVPAFGNMLGDGSVWIAFRFTSDGNTTDRGAFVDQVRIQKTINKGCAGAFTAEYFNNKELSGKPVFTRCESAPINHNWGNSGPGGGLGNDHFSVRWTGTFDFAKHAYNFVAIADDGVRVWLDDEQILNNWQDQGLTPNLATREVSAGKHTLRIEYYEHEGGAAAQFRWLQSDTITSNRQAFDTCFLPHPSEMQNWWDNSPYYEIGIYIGGSNRGCKAHNEKHLTASWIDTVQKQGWNFIPTWVGPQAPCTQHNFYTMSSDPGVAFAEGQREAGDAAAAARRLGLTTDEWGGTVIYYDMEPYPNDTACREAVKSFMAGWASRLHELGNQAGGYGAACASYITDWVLSPPYTIDQVWPAAWIHPAFNDSASVWDVSCIDNSLWSDQQRIRQYAGDHDERWGGLTLHIDSNVARGQVAGNIPRTAGVDAPTERWQPTSITDMALLADKTGWVIAQGQFLWTEDGGATWMNRTPRAGELEAEIDVRAATFLDQATGWLVGAGLPDAQGRSPLYVGKSTDGGVTWDLHTLDAFQPVEPGSTQGGVELTFFDALTGYLQIKLASSSNFDLYALLKSMDGGITWQEVAVPGSSPVHFTDALTGWTVVTTTDQGHHMTTDGGATWQATDALPVTAGSDADPVVTAAAEMGAVATSVLENGTGWAFVTEGVCSGTKAAATDAALTAPFDCIQHTALLSTPDGGNTWLDITPEVD